MSGPGGARQEMRKVVKSHGVHKHDAGVHAITFNEWNLWEYNEAVRPNMSRILQAAKICRNKKSWFA